VRPAIEGVHASTWKALERAVFLRDWLPSCCSAHSHVALHSLRGSDPVVDHEWQQLEDNSAGPCWAVLVAGEFQGVMKQVFVFDYFRREQ
jgi:hypothetical protein